MQHCGLWPVLTLLYLTLNGIIAYVILRDLDLNFHVQHFNVNTSETMRASVKMRTMTFMAVDDRHRMASLRMFYSLTVTNFQT